MCFYRRLELVHIALVNKKHLLLQWWVSRVRCFALTIKYESTMSLDLPHHGVNNGMGQRLSTSPICFFICFYDERHKNALKLRQGL